MLLTKVLLALAALPAAASVRLDRRAALRVGVGAASAQLGVASARAASLEGYDPAGAVTRAEAGRQYFPPLTPPLTNRATYRYELGRDAWALEQLLVFANVSATVRTIVIRLKDGKLWVFSPQWPTGEFCSLLEELGPVGHVVLPCNALEHKAPMGAFTKRYPQASVWVTPGQYGPFGSCGFDAATARMGYRVDGILPAGAFGPGDPLPPWADEFDVRTLYVALPENAGPVAEAAFVHKPSRTLVTVDSVVYIPSAAPPIFESYFSAAEVRQPDFWPKSVLQAVFLPLRYNPPQADVTAGVMSGAYSSVVSTPTSGWPGYDAVQGRLLRAPILRAFADARAPTAVREWVGSIGAMSAFDRIVTSHFASPIRATPSEYVAAFNYLQGPTAEPPIACSDWRLLDGLNELIETQKLGAPVVYDFKQGCPPA